MELMRNGHSASRAGPMLRDDQVRFTTARIVAFECIRSVQQDYKVTILFDATGFP
jgi:hypothetical protein